MPAESVRGTLHDTMHAETSLTEAHLPESYSVVSRSETECE